jgi:hypothetical protein
MATRFSALPSNIDYMTYDQTTDKVANKEPPPHQPMFNNMNSSGRVRWQLARPLVNIPNTRYEVGNPQTTTNPVRHKIKSHAICSIVNMCCCCLCLGSIAFYYSYKTNVFKKNGDLQEALKSSKKAATLNIIGTIIGTICIILLVLLYIIALCVKYKLY